MEDIQQYIQNGIVESYVLGLASENERKEFDDLSKQNPELLEAAMQFQQKLENHLFHLTEAPSRDLRTRVMEAVKKVPVNRPATTWKKCLRWLKQSVQGLFNKKQPPLPVSAEIIDPPKPPIPPDNTDLPDPSFDDSKKFRNEILLKKVLKRPRAMDTLNGRQFEEFVADLITVLGFTAKLTKATKDGGKDIIVLHHTEFGDFTFYMECKHKSGERKVGVAHIRQLLGTVVKDRVTAGIMVTNSYFSAEAICFQKSVANTLKLINRDSILYWIDCINRGTLPGKLSVAD